MRERSGAIYDATILDHAKTKPDAGARIRARRESILLDKRTRGGGWTRSGMSMRDLERRMDALARQNPAKFQSYSRTIQSKIENNAEHYLLHEIESERKVLAMIEVLYDGNVPEFERDTGIRFTDIRASRRPVYHWLEGARGYSEGTVPFSRTPLLPAEQVFEAATDALEPLLIPGQLCGLVAPLYADDVVNQVVVLNHPERGLIAALAVHETRYLQRCSGEWIELDAAYEQLIGVAQWLGRRPR